MANLHIPKNYRAKVISKHAVHSMVFEIFTEGLQIKHDPNKKPSIFVLYNEFKNSSYMFG